MDVVSLAVILWVLMGLAGLAVGLAGLAATRRRLEAAPGASTARGTTAR